MGCEQIHPLASAAGRTDSQGHILEVCYASPWASLRGLRSVTLTANEIYRKVSPTLSLYLGSGVWSTGWCATVAKCPSSAVTYHCVLTIPSQLSGPFPAQGCPQWSTFAASNLPGGSRFFLTSRWVLYSTAII